MDTLKLGHIIEGEQNRDAVHMAVAPVVAAQVLLPGNHIGLNEQGEAHTAGKHIGVVDPFLLSHVAKGERFWVFLYPGTITGLRHEWTHPAFLPKPEAVSPADPADPKEASRKWLERIAEECGVDYERMMYCVENDDYIHMGENESYKNVLDGVMDEFQRHCEVVTGKTFKYAPYPFSCSC